MPDRLLVPVLDQQLLIYGDFLHIATLSSVIENAPKRRNYPVSDSCVKKNVQLLRMSRLEKPQKGNFHSNNHFIRILV